MSHDRSVHTYLRARSVRGTQLMAASWDFVETKALLGIWGDADVQNQLNEIVRNKAIYQTVQSTQRDSKEQSHLPDGTINSTG